MKRKLLTISGLLLFATLKAQLNFPNASPDAEFVQQIGFGKMEVKYSRPSARGRIIFGDLVPFGEMWRTGAHDATTIRFSEDVKLNGNHIPAGAYSLFTIPGESEWIIILNKATEMHGTADYEQERDLVRFTVKPEKSMRYYETFTIEVNDMKREEAGLFLLWEYTQVRLTIKMNVDEKIMAEIHDRINIRKENRASLFFQSSAYYFRNNKDLKQAYTWIQMANDKVQDALYLQLQAEIEAAMQDYASAFKTLKNSTDLAVTKKLEKIVAANEKLRAEWLAKTNNK
jgi:hypothetical protein